MEALRDTWLEFSSYWDEPIVRTILIFILSFVVAWVTEVVVCRTLARLAAKTETDLDDQMIAAFRRPIFISVLFYGFSLAIEAMEPPERLYDTLLAVLQTITVLVWASASFAAGGLMLEALSRKAHDRDVLQQRTLPLFNMVLKGVMFGVAIYFLFMAWNIDVTAWLASAGIIGIAVGFAAKDTLANLFAGIFIIADAPYKIDDFIVLENGVRGRVTRIGVRTTRLLTMSDVEITIPNSVMGNAIITNEAGGPEVKYRVAVQVDAAYGSDSDKVRRVLLECAAGMPELSPHPTPRTRFREFGASGLAFELLVWIDDPLDQETVLDALHDRVYKAFNESDIEIPFSQHDLYLRGLPDEVVEAVSRGAN